MYQAVDRVALHLDIVSRQVGENALTCRTVLDSPGQSAYTYTQVSKLGNPADCHGREDSLRKGAMLQRDSALPGPFGTKIRLFTLSGFVPKQVPQNRIRMVRKWPCKQELIAFPSRWFEAPESSDGPLSTRSEREDQQTVLLSIVPPLSLGRSDLCVSVRQSGGDLWFDG